MSVFLENNNKHVGLRSYELVGHSGDGVLTPIIAGTDVITCLPLAVTHQRLR